MHVKKELHTPSVLYVIPTLNSYNLEGMHDSGSVGPFIRLDINLVKATESSPTSKLSINLSVDSNSRSIFFTFQFHLISLEVSP